MPTEIRPGDYRICPSCGARHKVQDLRCARCQAVLAGTPVRHASGMSIRSAGTPSSKRGLRAVLAVGLVVAVAAGFLVRSLFRGTRLQDAVEASAPLPSASATPSDWKPPVLNYPPVVGSNTGSGVPPSMAALSVQGAPASGAPA